MPRVQVVRRGEGIDEILDRVRHAMKGPKNVKVGFPAGMTGGEIMQRAIWNHYGTRGGAVGGGWGGPIPPRPFLENAIRDNTSKYRAGMRTGGKRILNGSTSLTTILRLLGVRAQNDIQREIVNLRSPANSIVTIELKGSSNPLIDTGEMRQAVTWKLDE